MVNRSPKRLDHSLISLLEFMRTPSGRWGEEREGEDYRFGKVLSLHIVPPIRVANIYIYIYICTWDRKLKTLFGLNNKSLN